MPDVIDELRATFARDMEAAKAKQSLVEVLAYCKSSLEAQGFSPTFVDEDGLLILSVDPEIREVAPLALPAPRVEEAQADAPDLTPDRLQKGAPWSPSEQVQIAEAARQHCLEKFDAEKSIEAPETEPTPEPAPPTAPAAEAKPEKKTGPWSDNEERLALKMAQDGRTTSQISRALGRAAPGVANKVKFLLRREREDAVARKVPPKPAPRPTSGLVQGAAKVASEPPTEFSTAERAHDLRVNSLGYPAPWTPEADLVLVSELAQGRKLASIAARLMIDPDLARQRFRALLPDPSWERQKQMLTVLRARAAKAA